MATSVHPRRLAERALLAGCAVISLGGEPVPLPPPPRTRGWRYGPLVGVRCGAGVHAVAYPLAARLGGDPQWQPVAIVVAADGAVALIDPRRPEPLEVTEEYAPAADVGRRALGLRTPPPPTSPLALLDTVWVDRMLDAVLDADLGSVPPWPPLSALHPLAGRPVSAPRLHHRRRRLRVEWEAFRVRATRPPTAWPGLDPAVAEWLDTGSFARWVLADLPDPAVLLADLADLLSAQVMAQVVTSLDGTRS